MPLSHKDVEEFVQAANAEIEPLAHAHRRGIGRALAQLAAGIIDDFVDRFERPDRFDHTITITGFMRESSRDRDKQWLAKRRRM